MEWDIKPGVLMGRGQLGVVIWSLEAVTHLCLLVQSSGSQSWPWAVSGAPGSCGSSSGGLEQAWGWCCLPLLLWGLSRLLPSICGSVGFCGRKLVLAQLHWDGWISALLPQGSNNKWLFVLLYSLVICIIGFSKIYIELEREANYFFLLLFCKKPVFCSLDASCQGMILFLN